MLADYLLNACKQGSLFKKFRDVVLGHHHINTLVLTATLAEPTEEHLGKSSPSARTNQSDPCNSNTSGKDISTTLLGANGISHWFQ